jgi:Rrf2 family protein
MRLAIELACRYGNGPIMLRDISKSQDISEKYLSQIILTLKSAGYVNSVRGAHGGYSLAKPPAQITALEIYEAYEGNTDIVTCQTQEGPCPRTPTCPTYELWTEISQKIAEVLSARTLEDLAQKALKHSGDPIDFAI